LGKVKGDTLRVHWKVVKRRAAAEAGIQSARTEKLTRRQPALEKSGGSDIHRTPFAEIRKDRNRFITT